MDITFAGSDLGNVFLHLLVSSSLETNGASKSYMIFGIYVYLLLRMPKYESEIVRGNKNTKAKSSVNSSTDYGYTFKERIKVKYFWLFRFGLLFLGMYVAALAT